jgi:hypothetical protein
VPIAVGSDPVAVTSCDQVANTDWSGTGKCGFAVSDAGSHEIAVLTGNGDGTFKPPVFYPVDGAPGAIAAGRLGWNFPPTITFVEPASDRAGALVGNGDGTFRPAIMTGVGQDPVAVEADTLEVDHEFKVVDQGSNDVRSFVIPNPSSSPIPGFPGGYLLPIGTTAVGAGPRAIASFGDGSVAVADHDSGDVTIFGGCGPVETVPAGPDPVALTYLHLIGPAGPTWAPGDLAVLNQGHRTLTLLTRNWNGSCGGDYGWTQPRFVSATWPLPFDPSVLVAASFDRHVLSDLALLNPAGQVSVLLNIPPRLTVEPRSIDFGEVSVGQTATAQIRIANVGTVPEHMRPASMVPIPEGIEIASDGCGSQTLLPRQSCVLTVAFAPPIIAQAANRLELDGDAYDALQEVRITGEGVAPPPATISTPRQSLTTAISRGLSADITSTGACELRIRVSYRATSRHSSRWVAIGSKVVRVSHAGRRTVKVALNAGHLVRLRSVALRLDATVTGRGIATRRLTSRFTLRR